MPGADRVDEPVSENSPLAAENSPLAGENEQLRRSVQKLEAKVAELGGQTGTELGELFGAAVA